MMVILGHQFEKNGLNTPLQFIQTFHMPLFFIIAGFLISDKADYKQFVAKRAKRLLSPYIISCLIATVLCVAATFFKDHTNSSAWQEMLKWLWISAYGSGSGHGSMIGTFGTGSEIGMMWYLLALFWSSIVVKVVSKNKMAGIIALMISTIAIGTTMIFGWIPLSIQNGLATVMWVWLGYYIKENNLLSDIINFIRSPWIVIVLITWFLSAVYGCIHLYGNYYKLGIVDVIGAIAGCLIIFGVCNFLSKKSVWVKKILSWIGINSLLIYCLHFLENSVYPISSVIKKVATEPIIIALISWIGIVLITCFGAFLLGKLKVVKRIYG